MADIKWIKVATDMFDDRKIKQIACMPKGESIIIIWIKLLCLAGDINDRGRIYFVSGTPYTEQMLATQFGVTVQMIRLALGTLEKFAMISVGSDCMTIVNWEKHQNVDGMEKLREQTRKRVADLRKRKENPAKSGRCNVTCNADSGEDVTQCNVTCNADVTLPVTQCNATEVEEEKEKEKDYCCRSSTRARADDGGDDRDSENDGNYAEEKLSALGGIGKGVVYLTDGQMEELLDKLGLEAFNAYVERLASWIIDKNAKVHNHYRTILKWYSQDTGLDVGGGK